MTRTALGPKTMKKITEKLQSITSVRFRDLFPSCFWNTPRLLRMMSDASRSGPHRPAAHTARRNAAQCLQLQTLRLAWERRSAALPAQHQKHCIRTMRMLSTNSFETNMNTQINAPATAANKMNVFGASSAPSASFSCSTPSAKRMAPPPSGSFGFAPPRPGKGGFNPAMG